MNVFKILPLLLFVSIAGCNKSDNPGGNPTVTATDPGNNLTGVARNKEISFTFSEAMDSSTINNTTFTVKQGATNVSGTVVYSGNIAKFTPSVQLAASTAYTATITTGAKNSAGKGLANDVVRNFTTGGSIATLAVVDLGAAGNYVIVAKTAINNNSTSAVTGDLGLSPAATSYVTGFSITNATGYATSAQVTGKIYAADMAAPTPINMTTAVNNMLTAYNDAAGRPTPDFLELGTGNIGGRTLVPGLYKWTSTVTMPTDVSITGGANDVWIFQISGNLTISSAVKVILSGGAQAKNIFWQVAGQATLGTTSHLEGTILSMTGITFQTGASLNGRALAQTAVILDGSTITKQ
ncbi:MAG TPA: ice-binding family protein [Puia sp.]|nr:ice-binding family protein [Puia sp.]